MLPIRSLLVVLAAATVAVSAAQAPATAVTSPVRLFDGRSLDGWYTWTKEHHYEDPSKVFSVQDGMLHVSGEEWGGIATKQAFHDYHLTVEWRWGQATWGERKAAARDSGILVHGVGEDGAASGVWLESIEAQVIEGGAGDLILVSGKGKPSFTVNARQDGEQLYWDQSAPTHLMTDGRLNWFGRDPGGRTCSGSAGAATSRSQRGSGTARRSSPTVIRSPASSTAWSLPGRPGRRTRPARSRSNRRGRRSSSARWNSSR